MCVVIIIQLTGIVKGVLSISLLKYDLVYDMVCNDGKKRIGKRDHYE